MRLLASAAFTALVSATFCQPTRADDTGWTDRIDFSGDFRLRYEAIDEEFEERRDRARFRARFGFKAQIAENVDIVVRIASGDDNPVSTNVTLDSGFSTKDFGIDLAYVDWSINERLNIVGGKVKNPIFRAGGVPLLWDGDLNLEGFALKYDSASFFGTLGGYAVEERSSEDDSLLLAAQGGARLNVSDNGRLVVGAGFFAYTNTAGNAPFYNGRAKGNTVDFDGNYVHDYENIEVFLQFDTEVSGLPLQLFASVVENSGVSVEDTGYAFGAKLGKGKKKGESQFAWIYQDIEADAVIGTFNDSDFGGGGTDGKGHILKAKYAYTDKIILGGTLFLNDIDRFQGIEHDYSRLQLDLEFKFN